MIGIIKRWDLFTSKCFVHFWCCEFFMLLRSHFVIESGHIYPYISEKNKEKLKESKDRKRENNNKEEKVVRFYFGISHSFNILIRYGHRLCWITIHNESRTSCVKKEFLHHQPDVLQFSLWNSKRFHRTGITNEGDCQFEQLYSFVGCHRSFHATKCIRICMTHANLFDRNSTSNLKCIEPSMTRWPRKPKSKHHSNISPSPEWPLDHPTIHITHTENFQMHTIHLLIKITLPLPFSAR